jgi:hypothetical protein
MLYTLYILSAMPLFLFLAFIYIGFNYNFNMWMSWVFGWAIPAPFAIIVYLAYREQNKIKKE